MSVVDFEKQGCQLAAILDTVRRLEETVSGGNVRFASMASLAKRYDCSKNSIRDMLHQMIAKGYAVTTSKVGTNWRVEVEQFDKAYDALFRVPFV